MDVKIKICGLMEIEHIETVNKVRPDYVGFVFANSKRQLNLEQAKALIARLDGEIKKVGVFQNQKINEVKEIANSCNLDIVQLHGDESDEYCKEIGREVWKSISISDKKDVEKIYNYSVDTILLDTKTAEQSGGTGKTFDWNLVREIKDNKRIVLAGGLNSDNVIEAIIRVKPFCVDVSSGVETNGKKDPAKIEKFINLIRSGKDGFYE